MKLYGKEKNVSQLRLCGALKKLYGILAGVCLLVQIGQGQAFQYRAEIEPAPQSGFYRIVLPAEVVGHLNEQFSDLRLYDQQQEVPYLLKREQPVRYQTLFREYKLVSKEITPQVATVLVLQNPARTRINNLSLLIKNAHVSKKARLSGSNDAQNWYVIEEGYRLEAIDNQEETAEVKILDFPLSDYEYYQLEINDSLSAPLNILRVGYYDVQAENGKYALIPGISFTKRDSSAMRQSYLHVMLADTSRIDKLTIRISAPAFYRRSAQISQLSEHKDRRGKPSWVYNLVSSLELSSSGENTVFLSGFRAKDFDLIINNEDNRPLTIDRLEASQLHTYLIAQLDAGKKYHLAYSNAGVGSPSYDLRFFQDKIPANLAVLDVKSPVHTLSVDHHAGTTLFSNRNIIWLAIGGVLLVLSYMSFRMLKEVGKR